jgi:hypothetical protein
MALSFCPYIAREDYTMRYLLAYLACVGVFAIALLTIGPIGFAILAYLLWACQKE